MYVRRYVYTVKTLQRLKATRHQQARPAWDFRTSPRDGSGSGREVWCLMRSCWSSWRKPWWRIRSLGPKRSPLSEGEEQREAFWRFWLQKRNPKNMFFLAHVILKPSRTTCLYLYGQEQQPDFMFFLNVGVRYWVMHCHHFEMYFEVSDVYSCGVFCNTCMGSGGRCCYPRTYLYTTQRPLWRVAKPVLLSRRSSLVLLLLPLWYTS